MAERDRNGVRVKPARSRAMAATRRRSTRVVVDRLRDKLADRHDLGQFDPVQLRRGTRVEREHTRDRGLAAEIAMDHLAEHPNYYVELAAMEKRLATKRRAEASRRRAKTTRSTRSTKTATPGRKRASSGRSAAAKRKSAANGRERNAAGRLVPSNPGPKRAATKRRSTKSTAKRKRALTPAETRKLKQIAESLKGDPDITEPFAVATATVKRMRGSKRGK